MSEIQEPYLAEKVPSKTKPGPLFPRNLSTSALASVLGVDRSFDFQPEEVLALDRHPARNEGLQHLDSVGIERVCEAAQCGLLHTEIADGFGVSLSVLYRWLHKDPARARPWAEAQMESGDAWMARGLARVEAATDALEMAKAREIIYHCRKMAGIRNPRYSDRVQVTAEVVHRDDPATIDARLNALLALVKPG